MFSEAAQRVASNYDIRFEEAMLLVVDQLGSLMMTLAMCGLSEHLCMPHALTLFEGRPSRGASTDLRLDAYRLCVVEMRDCLGIAPVVESFDDLMRLRDDKRVVAFRKVLQRWEVALATSQTEVLSEIRAELVARNGELAQLEKWRKVERCLFLMSLPVALIPIISTIHTVASFCVGYWIERRERDNWLGFASL